MGYLNLEQIYKLKLCIFIHNLKIKNKDSSIKLFNLNHDYDTRNNNLLETIKIKSNFGKKNLLYNGILTYNALPNYLKNNTNISIFKRNCKKYFSCNN